MPKQLSNFVVRMKHSDRGAAMVEYALLVALIAIVAMVAIQLLGSNLSSSFSTIDSTIIDT